MRYTRIKNRKGTNDTAVVVFMLSLVAVVITIGVSVLVLDAFNASQDTDSNTSTIDNKAQEVFGDGVDMQANFTSQLPTIGTIGGILLLVVLISLVGIGGYNYFRKGRGY